MPARPLLRRRRDTRLRPAVRRRTCHRIPGAAMTSAPPTRRERRPVCAVISVGDLLATPGDAVLPKGAGQIAGDTTRLHAERTLPVASAGAAARAAGARGA